MGTERYSVWQENILTREYIRFFLVHSFQWLLFRQPAIATGMTATSTTLGGGATLGRPLRTLPRRRTGASWTRTRAGWTRWTTPTVRMRSLCVVSENLQAWTLFVWDAGEFFGVYLLIILISFSGSWWQDEDVNHCPCLFVCLKVFPFQVWKGELVFIVIY